MKKMLLLSAITVVGHFARSQSTIPASTTSSAASSSTYKAFKVDLDFGYAIPSSGAGTKAGATFTIEPHYRLSDAFAIGLRFEGAGLGYENEDGSGTKVKVSLLTSYCFTADYYFTKSSFRAFVGGGAGLFSQKSESAVSGVDGTISAGATKFGVFPRIGFEYNHFRMAATYDVVGDNANYLSFTIGFFLGGGKK